MESARDKVTGEIIEAETLWLLEDIDIKGYICWGCGIDMSPASWRKENKKRPYFSKYRGQSHANDCDADVEENIVNSGLGKNQSIQNQLETLPGLSPSSLLLIQHRDHVDNQIGINEQIIRNLKNKIRNNDQPNLELNKKSRRPVNTIRPICRAFINFPYDRRMSLNVPGLNGYNYLTIFKKLSNNEIKKYGEAKIFYSPLQWCKIIRHNDLLIIPLAAGVWNDNKLTKSYQIHVDWSLWSKAKKTMLFNELEAAQEEAKLAKKEIKKDKAWVFFIGEQDNDNSEIFHVKDQRLICSIIGNIIYPELN